MKERTLKTKLLTVLLTLCLALSIVPISAFAESGAYAVKFYPGDYGTMTKNDQIPFVHYGIDDDVNKPYYYKLNVSETETLSFAGSISHSLQHILHRPALFISFEAICYQLEGLRTSAGAYEAANADRLFYPGQCGLQ